ncbi:hypothetical protein Zmor_014406 [Zophobas morio]|uniref:Uncharacterized protein n=1 Tax=Zophobas morio TaxID=2755281 RepID=A0AA38IFX0_9CUCU|nr:hypothetical protein Zmor_014406 [Zophobas morio]
MPPKKKRGGQNQVTFVVSKMSTRSGKKTSASIEKSKIITKVTPMPKSAPKTSAKKAKSAAKSRAKKSVPKKQKNEVKSSDSIHVNNPEIEEMLSEFERDDDTPRTEPIEQVFLKMEDGYMDATDVENSETEACEITEQLENLNVEECSFSVGVECVDESNINESTAEENLEEEVVEIDACEDFAVEYITEEFVPVVENTEVIIDDESQTSIILDKDACENEKSEEGGVNAVKQDEEKIKEIDGEPMQEEMTMEEVKTDDEKDVKLENTQEQYPEEVDKPEIAKSKKKPIKKDKETKKNPPKKKPKPKQPLKKEPSAKTEEVRRSSRIKSISDSKQRSKGHGLVKSVKTISEPETIETANASNPDNEKSSDSTTTSSTNEIDNKPVKVKSRWRQ